MNDNNESNNNNNNNNTNCILTVNESITIVRKHYEKKGYLVHSGLQFGCELVLYADDPSRVHSDFCVHVVPQDGGIDWRLMQTLVRSMPDFHKTLILAHVRQENNNNDTTASTSTSTNSIDYIVDELAMTSEHAPFQNKKKDCQTVGTQVKKQSKNKINNNNNNNDNNDNNNNSSSTDNTSSLNNECNNDGTISNDSNNKKSKIIHDDNT